MARIETIPTEKNRDVWQYCVVEGHSRKEAADHFGLDESSICKHIKRYEDYMPLPEGYIDQLRNHAKRIAAKALDVIETNLGSEKPDMHTAIQVGKGTGVLVERQEIETSLVVHDSVSPEERFKAIRDEWARRNLDFASTASELDTTPKLISDVKTNPDIIHSVLKSDTTLQQIVQVKTDTGEQK